MLLRRHDAGDVFLQIVVVLRFDEVLPPFHRKDDLKINLGVRHARNMPLLRSLGISFRGVFYKDAAPDGA